MKFRKKPVVIEAWRVPHDSDDSTSEIPKWLIAAITNGTLVLIAADGKTYIKTLEGRMTADQGDWIIQGVKGELYPCKPDIFEATYEAVT
jgi:hypothetical protein